MLSEVVSCSSVPSPGSVFRVLEAWFMLGGFVECSGGSCGMRGALCILLDRALLLRT